MRLSSRGLGVVPVLTGALQQSLLDMAVQAGGPSALVTGSSVDGQHLGGGAIAQADRRPADTACSQHSVCVGPWSWLWYTACCAEHRPEALARATLLVWGHAAPSQGCFAASAALCQHGQHAFGR